MTAPMTQATYVAAAVTNAQARGVTDAEELRRIRADAVDFSAVTTQRIVLRRAVGQLGVELRGCW